MFNSCIFLKRLALSLFVLLGLGAQDPRPNTKVSGKSLPDPLERKTPWAPPATKLPRFLVSATSALFDQGMADPRGCEYREVKLDDGDVLKDRAFVLPKGPGDARRFAVGWDGILHPAAWVGPAADLDADVRALAESMRRVLKAAANEKSSPFGPTTGFKALLQGDQPLVVVGAAAPVGFDERSPLKLCLLLRLGRADLAEALFAAGTTWTPEIQGRDLTDYHISYLMLAQEWAARMFVRLVDAHARGDDAIALDAARRLSAFAKAAEARAAELGFKPVQFLIAHFSNHPSAYFPFLHQVSDLLADQERRAMEAPHELVAPLELISPRDRFERPKPIKPRGTDPAVRIAALVRDLDAIAIPQTARFQNSANGSPLVAALIAEGDAAVEPLLSAVESDMRLTRTVTRFQQVSIYRLVHPVLEPELAALTAIFKTQRFSGVEQEVEAGRLSRKNLARAMRDYWAKNRALPMLERWYRTLKDDSSGHSQWVEAAANIVVSVNRGDLTVQGDVPLDFILGAGPMKGEALRPRRDPSVSELLARRALETARAPRPREFFDNSLEHACKFALMLDQWDPKASLPVVRDLAARVREAAAQDRGPSSDLSVFYTRFVLIRARAGEQSALTEYAAEVRKWAQSKGRSYDLDDFEPFFAYPDFPAIRATASWLFNNPSSSLTAPVREPTSPGASFIRYFYESPLLRSAGFREAVLDALTNRSEVGTARVDRRGMVEYAMKGGSSGSFGTALEGLGKTEWGVDQEIRTCDFIAWKISTIRGAPRCELYWSKEKRDAMVEACAEFLKTYGDRFTAEPPRGASGPSFLKWAYLKFPVLDRPATREDVRAGRAIFSLEGEGKARLVKTPLALPVKARPVPPRKTPDGSPEDGWIWQAEEVLKDGRWERYYGFVGRHVVAKVPGGSIELIEDPRPVIKKR